MKKQITAILGFLTLLFISTLPAYAESSMKAVKSFTEMQKYVEKFKDPTTTLVVMDDDDTLTMMSCPDKNIPETCQYLGGPAWFSWQQAQVEKLAQPRVANSFDELLTVSSLLLSINYMPYTAADVPVVLNKLVASGVRLMVETARGNSNVSATEQQFARLDTNNQKFATLLSLISNNSLKFGKDGMTSKASPYSPCGNRPVTYRQGSMYLSGQNKGTILRCMLDDYNETEGSTAISNVVFIDDTEKNVKNVHKAFEESKYNVYALHYTALTEHKKALTKGEMAKTYQENAMKRWKAIRKALEGNLQNPSS